VVDGCMATDMKGSSVWCNVCETLVPTLDTDATDGCVVACDGTALHARSQNSVDWRLLIDVVLPTVEVVALAVVAKLEPVVEPAH
jgi:hypothetical protein